MGQVMDKVMPQQQGQQDDVPWMLKYSARAMGAGGGCVAIAFGLVTCLSFSASCIIAGIWLVLAASVMVVMEAPCCCMWIEFAQPFGKWADERPYFHKAAVYLVLSLPAVLLCFNFAPIFGSALIFVTAVLYGMMGLGKKATREEMIQRSASMSDDNLVDNMEAGRYPSKPT